MTSLSAWLADVATAGGDTQAPPSPNIPTGHNSSRSPTLRMVDLNALEKPVSFNAATTSEDVPADVRELDKSLKALSWSSKGVIPAGMTGEIQKDNDDLADVDDLHIRIFDGRSDKELQRELDTMRDIRDGTSKCTHEQLHEPSWNELGHSRMLNQAVLGHAVFECYNITTARVIKELVPDNEYGEVLQSKMIDYAVTLGPTFIAKEHILRRLTASPPKLHCTCNASEHAPLCFKPVALSIETKYPDGRQEDGEVQLSV